VVLDGIGYGEQVTVHVREWRPCGYFRVSLQTSSGESTKEYISWNARIVPLWCAANYVGTAPSFAYTPQNDAAMATVGLKAWVLDDLGLEEYVPA